MRILVTNDDGVDAVGLHVLARATRRRSATSWSRRPTGSTRGPARRWARCTSSGRRCAGSTSTGVPEAWSVTGPPALCVMFARLGVFGDAFDLVVSGINPGANSGRAIYHSGTVGAALTARNGGVSGLAVSQAVADFGVEGQGWDEMLADQRWDTAAEVGAARGAGDRSPTCPTDPVVINVNVPNRPLDEIGGLAPHRGRPAAAADAGLRRRSTPKVGHDDAFDVRMEWGDPIELPDDTDSGAVEAGLRRRSPPLSRIARRPVGGPRGGVRRPRWARALVLVDDRRRELRAVEAEVGAVARQELVVVPCSTMLAVLHHEDDVGAADGRQAVGDHEAGAVRRAGAFIASWICTSVRVSTELVASSRMRIGRLGEEGAGDREQLLLAGADVVALLVDHRVVAVGQVSARSGRRRWPGPRRGSPPRWRRGGRRRCCRGSCRRRATCPAAPCRCCERSSRRGIVAMSRPSRRDARRRRARRTA